jgi:hypothetical protein
MEDGEIDVYGIGGIVADHAVVPENCPDISRIVCPGPFRIVAAALTLWDNRLK